MENVVSVSRQRTMLYRLDTGVPLIGTFHPDGVSHALKMSSSFCNPSHVVPLSAAGATYGEMSKSDGFVTHDSKAHYVIFIPGACTLDAIRCNKANEDVTTLAWLASHPACPT